MSETPPLPLEVRDVSTKYGSRKIFSGVTFDVHPGEIFGLIGLNGVGKTTLIRSILGLRAAEGELSLFGKPSYSAEARKRIVYLPEKFQPSAQLLGWEYLSIMLAYFGQSVDRAKAREIAAGLDLDPAAIDRKVKTYSKGMGQKLGLAATFLADVALMILDEPMSGLDPLARVMLKDRLLESRKSGRSIFFSSHILADIEEICDRIAVLHAGRIIFLGTPQEFIARHVAPSLERAFLGALAETDRAAS